MGKKMFDTLTAIDGEPLSVGQLIKSFRKAKGFTLKDLEEITGISQTHLSSLENDKIELGIKRAGYLASAFGVRPQDILFPNGVWEKSNVHHEIEERVKKFAGE